MKLWRAFTPTRAMMGVTAIAFGAVPGANQAVTLEMTYTIDGAECFYRGPCINPIPVDGYDYDGARPRQFLCISAALLDSTGGNVAGVGSVEIETGRAMVPRAPMRR